MLKPSTWLDITHHTKLSKRTREICHRRLCGGFTDATITFEDLSPDEMIEEIRDDFDVLSDLGFQIIGSDNQYTVRLQ